MTEQIRDQSIPSSPERRTGDDEKAVSLLRLAAFGLRHRYLITGATLGMALMAAGVARVLPESYTADASFIPQQQEGGSSRLASLAGQFGFNLPGAEAGASPEFYVELIRSRAVLGHLADHVFAFSVPADEDSTQLAGQIADLLEFEADTPGARRDRTIRWLGRVVTVRAGLETGIVKLSVNTPWAGLSEQIAAGLLDAIHAYNLESRQSRASAERRFAQQRMRDAEQELLAVEDSLRVFLQQNRGFENSPELLLEYDRLQRRLAMRQAVFTSLAEAFEKARISEVRNTPAISVVDAPERPARPDDTPVLLYFLLGLVGGALLGASVAFGRDQLEERLRQTDDDVEQLKNAWRAAKRDVRTFVGVLGRRPGGTGS